MKKRLISVAVGLVLLAALVWLMDTPVLPVALSAIGVLAVFEGLRALGLEKKRGFLMVYGLVHILTMFVAADSHYVVYLLLFATFCLAMFSKGEHVGFKTAAGAFAIALMVTLGFGSVLRMVRAAQTIADARFMVLMGLAVGWLCDTFAFTFGKLFGKRKMCPSISPNKTVAGGVGGVCATPVVYTLAFYIYAVTCGNSAFANVVAQYGAAAPCAFFFVLGTVGAVVGMLGDLAASFIKRECGIKDFGNIMPGHGGALDRLDSILFTSTLCAFAFRLFFQLFKLA